AGGFVRHPVCWGANLARWCGDRMPLELIRFLLLGYAKVAAWRFRGDAQTASSIRDYIARFSEQTRKAATHRLHLVATNDPSPTPRQMDVPLFSLAGFWDPIVPWLLVRPWLKRNCPALREYRLLLSADHNVFGTA